MRDGNKSCVGKQMEPIGSTYYQSLNISIVCYGYIYDCLDMNMLCDFWILL